VDFIDEHGSLGSHRALFYASEIVGSIKLEIGID
jgi:hypothetical protein